MSGIQNRPLFQHERDQFVARYQAGETIESIHRDTGRARDTISRALREAGVASRTPRLTAEERAEIIRRRQRGESMLAIATALGRGIDSVRHAIRHATESEG